MGSSIRRRVKANVGLWAMGNSRVQVGTGVVEPVHVRVLPGSWLETTHTVIVVPNGRMGDGIPAQSSILKTRHCPAKRMT